MRPRRQVGRAEKCGCRPSHEQPNGVGRSRHDQRPANRQVGGDGGHVGIQVAGQRFQWRQPLGKRDLPELPSPGGRLARRASDGEEQTPRLFITRQQSSPAQETVWVCQVPLGYDCPASASSWRAHTDSRHRTTALERRKQRISMFRVRCRPFRSVDNALRDDLAQSRSRQTASVDLDHTGSLLEPPPILRWLD